MDQFAQSIDPDPNYRYDFPFRTAMPRGILTHPNNPYLQSQLFTGEVTSRPDSDQNEAASEQARADLERVFLVPYHLGELVEPRLSSVRASLWTPVASDDALIQKLLHFYFLCEYPSFAFFSKDAFLNDLAREGNEHCSPLLVNCILATASQGLARIDTRSRARNEWNMTDRFVTEARRLWEAEVADARLTTVQAGCMLAQLFSANGTDEEMIQYAAQTASLAHDLGLFVEYPASVSQTEAIARAVTAWGFFDWQALICFYRPFAPILEGPPEEPLPSYDHAPLYYGELLMKYPHTSTPYRLHFGHTLLAGLQLSIISNELVTVSRQGSQTGNLDLRQALHYHRRLEEWYNELPENLAPDEIVFPHQLKAHMYYYTIIINLFTRLLSHPEENGDFSEAAVARRTERTSTIAADAKLKLETVLRMYYLRYGFDFWDLFMVQSLGVLAYATLDKINGIVQSTDTRDELTSTLVLCLKGLQDQSRNYSLADRLLEQIFSSMDSEEASFVRSLIPVASVEPRGG